MFEKMGVLSKYSFAVHLLMASSFFYFAVFEKRKESVALLVACPWADHMHHTDAVGNAFVDFASVFVLIEDASVSNALVLGCALPYEESSDMAATLVDLDFGTREPYSDHHAADSE